MHVNKYFMQVKTCSINKSNNRIQLIFCKIYEY